MMNKAKTKMNQNKIRAKLGELWDEVAALSRDDAVFHKKRMFLYAQIFVYTKIFAVVRRIKRSE